MFTKINSFIFLYTSLNRKQPLLSSTLGKTEQDVFALVESSYRAPKSRGNWSISSGSVIFLNA